MIHLVKPFNPCIKTLKILDNFAKSAMNINHLTCCYFFFV